MAHPIRQLLTLRARIKQDADGPVVRMSEINRSLIDASPAPMIQQKAEMEQATKIHAESFRLAENFKNISTHMAKLSDSIISDCEQLEDSVHVECVDEIHEANLHDELNDLDFKKFVDDLATQVLDDGDKNTNEPGIDAHRSRIVYERTAGKETIIIDSIPNKTSHNIHVVKVKITIPKNGSNEMPQVQTLTNTSTIRRIAPKCVEHIEKRLNKEPESPIEAKSTSKIIPVKRNPHHLPIMGKAALMNKYKNSQNPPPSAAGAHKNDSDIVRELVTQRFQDFLINYYEKSFNRQHSRIVRNNSPESVRNEDKASLKSTFHEELNGLSSIASLSQSSSAANESTATVSPASSTRVSTPSSDFSFTSVNDKSNDSQSNYRIKEEHSNQQNCYQNIPHHKDHNIYDEIHAAKYSPQKVHHIDPFFWSGDKKDMQTKEYAAIDNDHCNLHECNTAKSPSDNEQKTYTIDSVSCDGLSTDFQEDYDATQFLKDALGDELTKYYSTDVSNLNNSIGTSNISALISKAGTYEDTMHTSDYEYPMNKRVNDLLLRSAAQYQVIVQTSKALSFCRSTKEFSAGDEELEAERILLIATCKRDAIKEEIHRLEYEEVAPLVAEPSSYGCIKISKIVLPPKQRNPVYQKFVDKKKKRKFADHFICLLTHGADVQATHATQSDSDGFVRFDDEIIFDHLQANFEIDILFFCMRVRNMPTTMSHETKYHLHTEATRMCPLSPPKLFNHKEYKCVVFPDFSEQKSSYKLCGRFTLRLNNIGHLGHFKLALQSLPSLEGSFVMDFSTSVRINEQYSGFLDVGIESAAGIVWNRRWCVLHMAMFSYFNYPGEENPLGFIDLHYYANGQIGLADRQICARPRTLLVEMFVQHIDSNCRKTNELRRYFLAADSMQYMQMWESKLNATIVALRTWNAMCVSRF